MLILICKIYYVTLKRYKDQYNTILRRSRCCTFEITAFEALKPAFHLWLGPHSVFLILGSGTFPRELYATETE